MPIFGHIIIETAGKSLLTSPKINKSYICVVDLSENCYCYCLQFGNQHIHLYNDIISETVYIHVVCINIDTRL